MLPPVKSPAFVLIVLFATALCGSAMGVDLACADDCDHGVPCQTVCASCLCNPVLPASPAATTLGAPDSLGALAERDAASPLRGVTRSVLHVPLAA